MQIIGEELRELTQAEIVIIVLVGRIKIKVENPKHIVSS